MKTRSTAAAAVLVSAAIHLTLWLQGMSDEGVIGPAFLVNAVAGVVIAALLLRRRHWWSGLLAAGFGASTLGGFTLATTVGLFGDHETWQGGYVFAAAAAELVAIVAGVLVVLQERVPAPVQLSPVPVSNRSESA